MWVLGLPGSTDVGEQAFNNHKECRNTNCDICRDGGNKPES